MTAQHYQQAAWLVECAARDLAKYLQAAAQAGEDVEDQVLSELEQLGVSITQYNPPRLPGWGS